MPHRQSVGEGSKKIVCSSFVIGPSQQSSFMYSECPLTEQYSRFQKYVYVILLVTAQLNSTDLCRLKIVKYDEYLF